MPLLAVLAVLLAAIALRGWLLAVVDLRDLPGAAGGQTIAAAAAGAFHGDWAIRLVGLALPLTDGDIPAAAHMVAWISSGAMVLGATLGSAALAGWRGALAGAVVSAVWSQGLLVSMLIGPDPPAIGAAWLGVGLCWWSAGRGLSAPLAFVGAVLVMWSVAIKELALPALALLTLTPILGRGWGRLLGTAALLLGCWWGLQELRPNALTGQLQHSADLPALTAASLLDGLRAIFGMARGWPDGLLEQILLAALAAGLLPGPRWPARALTAIISVAVLGLTAAALGGRLSPRLLLGASFGGVVLLAVLSVRLTGGRLWGILLIGGGLSLDGLAWLSAWTTERTEAIAADPLSLPQAPRLWSMRYTGASYAANNGRMRDIATADGVTLAVAAASGLGLPPLRDRRDEMPRAIAALNDAPSSLLHPRLCCTEPHAACATRLVTELDEAGMTLVIPRRRPSEPMVDRPFEAWRGMLIDAAEQAGGLREDGWWWIRPATGSGGPVPCPESASE